MTVRLITPADDELYGLASAAGKLGRAAKLLDRLADAVRAAPADPQAAGRHALALMAVLPSIGIEFAAHARFTATVEALTDVLDLEPEHWLARYSRARLRTLIPSSYGAYAVQIAGDLDSAREDVDRLIAHQATLPPQPYFISAHALAAVLDELAAAPPTPGRPGLLGALAAAPREPVRLVALGAVLCEPLATLHAQAGTGAQLRTALGEVLGAVYGDQPAVAAVLRREAVPR
ncbi:hypothetical protein [Dactylosporangium sp. CA-233914]|uniref:hypothetical protein n=1 Tax=Dactylosporangium sp. CA-233914 TaxID=3239934 RepID=UPI003D8AF803